MREKNRKKCRKVKIRPRNENNTQKFSSYNTIYGRLIPYTIDIGIGDGDETTTEL